MIVGVGRWRQGEKPFGLSDGLAKPAMPLVQANEVDKITMFAGGCIDPIPNPATFRLEQAHIKAAAWRTGHIADHPVPPLAATGRQVMAADGLNILCKPLRQFARAG